MTGRKHRSNMELVAQGIANVGSALFGGLPVTGTIARTATNVRAGAQRPLSGMMHAVFLPGLPVDCRAVGQFRSTFCVGRSTCCSLLEYGGEKRISPPSADVE
jgi:hypothetical protein